jgi:hypothetical protein
MRKRGAARQLLQHRFGHHAGFDVSVARSLGKDSESVLVGAPVLAHDYSAGNVNGRTALQGRLQIFRRRLHCPQLCCREVTAAASLLKAVAATMTLGVKTLSSWATRVSADLLPA